MVFKNLSDSINVFSGDILQIWSKPFNKKLYVNYGSAFGSNWYELVFDMKNKDLNKQDFFKIQKVSTQNVKQIFNKKFENDLLKIKELSSRSERIASLGNLLRDMNLNISLNNRAAFFNLLKKIYEKRYKLDEFNVNKLQAFLNQCLKSVLNKEQKDLISSWMQSLDETKFEGIITKKMTFADAAKDFDLKINSYKDVLMLIRNPLGKNKVCLFLNSLEKLFKSKNNMNIIQLNALKNLFQNSEKNFREMNFLTKKDLCLKTLEQNNLDLDFYIKLYEAEHSDGEEKIRRFNKIIPFLSKNVSNELKLTCLELLNKTLGSKAEELRTIRELLDLAMTKTVNDI